MSNELEMLTAFFIGRGASKDQAKTMADQLLKRALQIAKEQKVSEVEALRGLLERINKA